MKMEDVRSMPSARGSAGYFPWGDIMRKKVFSITCRIRNARRKIRLK